MFSADIPSFPCDNADLVIAVDSALVQNSAVRTELFTTFATNYRTSFPNNRLDIVEFSSTQDNSAGILQIKTKLDAAGARNNQGFTAGRLGLLITGNNGVTDADRTAIKQLRDSGTNTSIITTQTGLVDLETLLEPRDRTNSVKSMDLSQFGHQHHVVQAMLCRQVYVGKVTINCQSIEKDDDDEKRRYLYLREIIIMIMTRKWIIIMIMTMVTIL
jgi:hypothetical protein